MTGSNEHYWTFSGRDDREYVHSLFQYPAMMVPRLQRRLIQTFVSWDPTITTVYDPFLGSGTVMTEAMLRGLDFFGGDINPLAILIARAKSEVFDVDRLDESLSAIIRHAKADMSTMTNGFPNVRKWFQPHVIEGLHRIRKSIMACDDEQVRRFWWVALAETIRLASNSRTSTVKLHIRPSEEIDNRPEPLPLFERIARHNLQVIRQQKELLQARGYLMDSNYCGRVALRVGDVLTTQWDTQADLMVTSPPYGDNHTTVTYGQASYLPLQWIDRRDIGKDTDAFVENTHRIDTLSLGGRKRRHYPRLESLLDRSEHLRRVYDALSNEPYDRRSRVISFYSDLDARLGTIVSTIRHGGLLVWTTGDRTVGGIKIAMAPILQELLGHRTEYVTSLSRMIPHSRKRMPKRNASVTTMEDETILIVRRTEIVR